MIEFAFWNCWPYKRHRCHFSYLRYNIIPFNYIQTFFNTSIIKTNVTFLRGLVSKLVLSPTRRKTLKTWLHTRETFAGFIGCCFRLYPTKSRTSCLNFNICERSCRAVYFCQDSNLINIPWVKVAANLIKIGGKVSVQSLTLYRERTYCIMCRVFVFYSRFENEPFDAGF